MARRTGFLVVVLSAALVGCGSDEDDTSSSPAAAKRSTAPSSATENGPLEGTWQTAPITVADMAATVREAGLEESVDGFEQNAPISDAPTALILELDDETWNLYGQAKGGQREEIDYDASYEVRGDRVIVSHENDANTYRWSVEEDFLELAWVKTTYGDYKGIPEEAFQRALYMTAGFERTP